MKLPSSCLWTLTLLGWKITSRLGKDRVPLVYVDRLV